LFAIELQLSPFYKKFLLIIKTYIKKEEIMILFISRGLLFLFLASSALQAQNSGNALSLDGVDDYAAPLIPNVSGFNEGTIEFWFAPESWTPTNSIWNGGNGHPGVNGDWVKIGGHSPTAGNENLVFGVYAGTWRWSNSGVIPTTEIWRHVAATWSSTGLKIYMDGMLLNTNGYSSGLPTYATELIGVSAWGEFFNGSIDEVRIWNYERNASLINSTMFDTLAFSYYSTSDSGLIAYYRMDVLEDLGINGDGADDLRDLSINENHLDTYGTPSLEISGAFVITNVEQINNHIPTQFRLSQNYPNPFNPSTLISWQSPVSSWQTLKIYDILGNEVSTLVDEFREAGRFEITFDASNLASGMYLYRLQSGNYVETKKMVIIK
jgi:hypothetical protein